MKQTLNIPLSMLKRYRGDKRLWELFVFAVCLKCVSGSSGIHPDVMLVRKLMRCSHYKAERMIKRAKHCSELFYYNEKKNFLVARSFTRGKLEKATYYSRNKEYVAYRATCFKFRYEHTESISHIDTSRMLRDKLITSAIYAKSRKNDLPIVVKKSFSTRSERAEALSTMKLAHIAGMHHSTVSRHLRKMEKTNLVKVTRHPFIKVADFYSGELLTDNKALLERKPFLRQGYLVVRDANDYKLTSACADKFVNVIFNHEKRRQRNYSKTELALAHYDN